MRFVWAVVAFVLAAVCIGAGIAQRTVFMGPKTAQTQLEVAGDLPYILIDGDVLSRMPGSQTLMARGDGTVFAAYGRSADMKAWLADASYDHVALKSGKIVSQQVQPSVAPSEGTDAAAGRDPSGADLWLDQFQQDGVLIAPLKLPADMSVLVASDGTAPAPSDLTVSWPLDNATPWAGPLILLGGLLLLLGILLWALGIRNVRRSRGPRRKGLPPLPDTEPIDLTEVAEDKGVITAGEQPSRRSIAAGRRALIAVPAIGLSAALFAGCSADAWPQLGGGGATPTPSPTSSVIVPEGQQAPAVTETQAARILTEISDTVAQADADLDPDLAATRLGGVALAERQTNYRLQKAVKDTKPLTSIPSKPVRILLPQAYDGWPRTVLSVVTDKNDQAVPPTIMLMSQTDPWSPYRVTYVAQLEASAQIPGVAPATIGAYQVPPDSSFLRLPPEQLAGAYADVLDNGDKSEHAGLFDLTGDLFHSSVATNRQQRLTDFNDTGKKTATLAFAASAGTEAPLALATLESGAIVAVNVHETDTVRPKDKDAVIKLDGKPSNPTVRALAGVAESKTGFTTTFTDQLFFYVPGQGSTDKIRLLGYASSILDAKVIKK